MKHLLTLALVLCLGTFASAQIPGYVPTNGLVGWWPFNGNANDESGNGRNGQLINSSNGLSFSGDRNGNSNSAVEFRSSFLINQSLSPYIEINNSSNLVFNQEYCFNIWTRIKSNTQVAELINKGPDNNSFFSRFQGILGFAFGNGPIYFDNTPNMIIDTANWHMYTFLRENNGLGKLYCDGQLILFQTISPFVNNNNSFAFGKMPSGGTNGSFYPYQGLLDDIAIYNRALTPAEVQQLYLGNSSNAPVASTVPGKIHYQGVAVGANGKPIKNGTVGLRLSVLDSLPNGITLYTETQTASTDAAGIFSTYLGGGTATVGTFANIPWANGNEKFLKVEMDAQGGSNYQNMGSTQLVSVPYAMAAGSLREGALLYGNNGQKYQITIDSSGPKWTLVPPAVAPFACGQAVFYAGESYPTVQIGTQCWFQKNVNAGTMVLGANDQTNNGILEKYCYDNLATNCDVYGGLYQWAEAVQYQNGASNTASPSPAFTGNIKGICPTGWHVPSDAEYCTLTTFLDATVNCGAFGWSGTDAGGKMKSVSGLWASPNTGATNSSGFSALPGGSRYTDGSFYYVGLYNYFWSSSESSSTNAIFRFLTVNDSNIYRYASSKSYSTSARCIQD
jgi:uncharacterized protein (TIGR02145 family)